MFSNENRMANNSNNSKRRNYRKNVQDSSHSSEIFQINSHLPEKCVYDDDPPNYTYISLFGTECYARCCVRTITSRQRRARECRQSFRAAAEGPLKTPHSSCTLWVDPHCSLSPPHRRGFCSCNVTSSKGRQGNH